MFDKISFSTLILDGLLLRTLFVFIGVFLSVKIIGIKNIFFLKDYINRSFFQKDKIIYWTISLLSLLYFEHLIVNAEYLSVTTIFNKNYWLSLLVLILLIGILLNAFIYMIASVENAKKTKQEINKVYIGKGLVSLFSVASFFIPGGVLARGLLFGGAFLFDSHIIDKKIENTLADRVKRRINSMLLIVLINLFLVIGATYLITNQIIFW